MPGVWKDSQLFNSTGTLLVIYIFRKEMVCYGIDNMNFTAVGKESFCRQNIEPS